MEKKFPPVVVVYPAMYGFYPWITLALSTLLPEADRLSLLLCLP